MLIASHDGGGSRSIGPERPTIREEFQQKFRCRFGDHGLEALKAQAKRGEGALYEEGRKIHREVVNSRSAAEQELDDLKLSDPVMTFFSRAFRSILRSAIGWTAIATVYALMGMLLGTFWSLHQALSGYTFIMLYPRKPGSRRFVGTPGMVALAIVAFYLTLFFFWLFGCGIQIRIAKANGDLLDEKTFHEESKFIYSLCLCLISLAFILWYHGRLEAKIAKLIGDCRMFSQWSATLLSSLFVLVLGLFGLWLLPTAIQEFLWIVVLIVAYPLILAALRLDPGKWTEEGILNMYKLGLGTIPIIGQVLLHLMSRSKPSNSTTEPQRENPTGLDNPKDPNVSNDKGDYA